MTPPKNCQTAIIILPELPEDTSPSYHATLDANDQPIQHYLTSVYAKLPNGQPAELRLIEGGAINASKMQGCIEETMTGFDVVSNL